tara:strand:- start:318 stop:689 length:372 start_codon:yes stop_codon:yes gene_type:complete
MRFIHIFLIASIILNFNFLKAEDIKTENKIAKNLRCLICQGQSVYDSDSEFAISLKLLIKNKIQEGMSEEEIYSFLKTKYGEWILYDPVFNRNTYFLWLLPLLIFLAGGAIIIRKFNNKNNLN